MRTRPGQGGSGGARPVPGGVGWLTRSQEVARFVHASEEQLESDDGINNDDEEHEQSDVQQRYQRLHDGIEHYVQACGERGLREVGAGSVQSSSRSPSLPSTPGGVTLTRDSRHQPQWPQHPKCPQRLHIEAPRLPSSMRSISRPSGALLQQHAEQPDGGARYEAWAGVRLWHPFPSLSSPEKSTSLCSRKCKQA